MRILARSFLLLFASLVGFGCAILAGTLHEKLMVPVFILVTNTVYIYGRTR